VLFVRVRGADMQGYDARTQPGLPLAEAQEKEASKEDEEIDSSFRRTL